MSVIYNWPDRCPSCGGGSFSVSSREKARLVQVRGVAAGGGTLPTGTIRCTCDDGRCAHTWRVTLATTTPVVFRHPTAASMAVVAPTPEEAELLVALPDDWKAEPLGSLLARGAARVEFVRQAAEAETSAAPAGG